MSWEDLPGELTCRDECDQLVAMARAGDTLVAVGVGLGKNVAYLAARLLELRKDTRLVTVDRWADETDTLATDLASFVGDKGGLFNAFLAAMRAHAPKELSFIELWRMPSDEASRLVGPGSCRGVLIDAARPDETLRQDIASWLPTVARGGLFVGAGYGPDFPEAQRAVWEALHEVGYSVRGTRWFAEVKERIVVPDPGYVRFLERASRALEGVPCVDEEALDHVLALPTLTRSGLWLEFGVYKGGSLARMARARGEARVYGFDSFRGLPEFWKDGYPAGLFALPGPPSAPPGSHLVVGLFDDTLPAFVFDAPVTLVHIDCDIYSSTKTALRYVLPHLAPGAMIVFDELDGYPGYEEHELLALYETTLAGLEFEWVVRHNEKVAIRVLRVDGASRQAQGAPSEA
jgi:predicted O-methyltransferase YrrM